MEENPNQDETKDLSQVESIVEGLLFVAGHPLSVSEIMDVFKSSEAPVKPTKREVEQTLATLTQQYEERGRSIRLMPVAEGYEFRTTADYAPWIRLLNRTKPQKLSAPAVETLAMIAYRQPITRNEIEQVRGVDSGGVLKSLGDRKLIKIVGRKEEAGRPLLYATTSEFLELFGLKDLSDLPPLNEFEEMIKSQGAGEATTEEAFTVNDLVTTPEELEGVEESDRTVLDDLDEKLKDLKLTEKGIAELMPVEPSSVDGPSPEA